LFATEPSAWSTGPTARRIGSFLRQSTPSSTFAFHAAADAEPGEGRASHLGVHLQAVSPVGGDDRVDRLGEVELGGGLREEVHVG
jgi:hypothetical protein